MKFGGFLRRSGNEKMLVKIAPRLRAKLLASDTTKEFELRPGGYAVFGGLAKQSKEDWYAISVSLYGEALKSCREMKCDPDTAVVTGYAVLVNDPPSGETVDLFIDDLSLYNNMAESGRGEKNIAFGRSYTWNIAPDAFKDGYQGNPMCRDANDAVQLTDGELAERCWWDPRTVGWWQEARYVNISIDLDGNMPVDTVAVHLSSEASGIRVPALCRVFIGNTTNEFRLIGELNKAQALSQWRMRDSIGMQDNNPHGWITLSGLRGKGRFLTVSLIASTLYLDEICVYAGTNGISAADQRIAYTSPDITPFYRQPRAYIAREVLTPLVLNEEKKGGQHLLFYLPEGIAIVAPYARTNDAIVENGRRITPVEVKNAEEVFLVSTSAPGTVSDIRIVGGASSLRAGTEQRLIVETISIPAVEPFKDLLLSSSFVDFAFWQRWPDVVNNYRRIGLNLFTPLSGNDYYYRLWKRTDLAVTNMLDAARNAGLVVGGNYSPYCNVQINTVKNGRKALYLANGKPSAVGCPRVYRDEYLADAENQDLNSVRVAAEAKLDFLFLDSEPSWGGDICSCSVCEAAWKTYCGQRNITFRASTELPSADDAAKAAYQGFWDEFYVSLWARFKSQAPATRLGWYGVAPGGKPDFGNRTPFMPLSRSNIAAFANPTLYHIPTDALGQELRKIYKAMPEGIPMIPWMTCGGGTVTFERTPEDLRNRLAVAFLSGARGVIFWSARGVDAREYQVMNEVIRSLRPYEDILTDGILREGTNVIAPDGVETALWTRGKRMLMLIARYTEGNSAASISSPLFAGAHAQTMIGTPVPIESGGMTIHFSGSEKDSVQLFFIARE
ncbi:MAG: hypothetical protein AABZ39_08030 [Spirochaetota bacterium]